ncbi:MAG TPA: hypothetical protein VLI42_00275 [Chthoniobacterales bacterium]|nr:hypothetical protein [Chthoniobacterales bacterium]
MKPGTFTHTIAVLLSSVSACFAPSAPAQAPTKKVQLSKKQNRLNEEVLFKVDPIGYTPPGLALNRQKPDQRYPWKKEIVTTVFWIGENPTANNPVPNHASSWDAAWAKSYGGYDDPRPSRRENYIPVDFTPRQNPFYCALPYNDKAREGHRPEAPKVVPWFAEAYQGPGVSVCKGRWVAIRKGHRTVYAQWEDAGPFRTDHWEYVFGNERPKPNLNHGAGLDVSPAVRDYLGLQDTDVTDWKFVEFSEVPPGPWARLGNNNTFVINQRKAQQQLVKAKEESSVIFR